MNQYRTMLIALTFIAFGQVQAEEKCLTIAWQAYKEKKFEHAIEFADACIREFGKQALIQQRAVKTAPPCGAVGDQDKAFIHRRGLLNDVATAAWIKANSAKSLGDEEIAAEAYTQVCELSHGRTWDTQGWFWSPCSSSCTQ